MKRLLRILALVALAGLASHVLANQTTPFFMDSSIQTDDLKNCNPPECKRETL